MNENKNENNNNNIIEENENENDNDNETNENKNNNEFKNQSFDLDENRENEIMFRNYIKCPKSLFIIYFSGISYLLIIVADTIIMGFGLYKDGNGEELFMWY